MADNLVSQPPLQVAMTNPNGTPSKAWAVWFRDLYRRTSYKGGNAIDDNKGVIDGTVDTLEEVIIVVEDHEQRIDANKAATEDNATNLTNHEQLESAHGSNGDIVGFNDTANNSTVGLVKSMVNIANAVQSTVSVVSPDVAAAPAAYDQAHSESLRVLANENKSAINQVVADLNAAVLVLNNLIQNSKDSGQMT